MRNGEGTVLCVFFQRYSKLCILYIYILQIILVITQMYSTAKIKFAYK